MDSESSRPSSFTKEMFRANLVGSAVRLFKQVSVKCPASVTAQAALIATACKEGEIAPLTLKEAILDSEQAIDEILKAALKAHNSHPENTKLVSLQEEEPMSRVLVVEVVVADFDFAVKMMGLDRATLDEITTSLYPSYVHNEPGFRDVAEALIRQQKAKEQ